MTIVQTNSLPLPLETFTQPCAEQRKSLVEQTEEITVELLLESTDIQLFGNKLRFLVAPQNERELQQCNSFFITLCICCKTVGRNSTPDYAAGQTIRPRKRFPAFRSGSRKKYEGKTGIGLNDYFCIGTNRRKHEKTLDRLHRITYRRPDRIPLHPLLLRFGEGVKSGELNYVVYKGLVFKTYEGKLIQSGIRSKTAGTIQSYEFEFSVENEALARKLMLLGGKNIELHYKEYFGALPWRGFSKFVVDSIVTKPIGSLPIDSETER